MANKQKILNSLTRFDDVIAQPFQMIVDLFSVRSYRLNEILRDVGCLVLSAWFVAMLATAFSSYSFLEKTAFLLLSGVVVIAEVKLLKVHNRLCKTGWTRKVSQLYAISALRYRSSFLLFRLIALVGFTILPLASLILQSNWSFVDVVAYLILLIYVWKFYLERSFPGDESSFYRHVMKTGETV